MKATNNIIFVGGIHGVGKTTLCQKISYELTIEHFSSSDLISMINSQRIKADKKVDNIQDNQIILLEAINTFLDKEKTYLLDGHFCLIGKDNSIYKISVETFKLLRIKGIIIITDYEDIILKRLKHRDNKDYTLEFIQKFQEKEILHAKYVAKIIGVPLIVINNSKDSLDIVNFIKKLK